MSSVNVHEYLPSSDGDMRHFVYEKKASEVTDIPDLEIVAERLIPVRRKVENANIHDGYKSLLLSILSKYATVRNDNRRMRTVDPKSVDVNLGLRWSKSRFVLEMAAKGRMAETLDFVDKLLRWNVNTATLLCAKRILFDAERETPQALPFRTVPKAERLFADLESYIVRYVESYKTRANAAHLQVSKRQAPGSVNIIQL